MFTSIPSLDPVLQCLLPAFTEPSFPDAHRGVARLGDVLGQANRVRSVPSHPGRYAPFSERATSVRPLLQLLQPHGLDSPRLGPPVGGGDCRRAQSARLVVPGRRRHVAAQTGQACLRPGLVPRCRGLDSQTGRDPPAAIIGWSSDWRFAFPERPRFTACRSTPSCILPARITPAKPRWPGKCSRTCWVGFPIESWFSSAMGPIRQAISLPISTRG